MTETVRQRSFKGKFVKQQHPERVRCVFEYLSSFLPYAVLRYCSVYEQEKIVLHRWWWDSPHIWSKLFDMFATKTEIILFLVEHCSVDPAK